MRSIRVAKLIYSAITSLDGYVADTDGNFDWAVTRRRDAEPFEDQTLATGE